MRRNVTRMLLLTALFMSGCSQPASTNSAAPKKAEPAPSSEEGGTQASSIKLTEEQAKQIALKAVSGEVTDVAIEKKLGANRYVVEILADNGIETDVIIDMDTGEVLDTET